MIRAARFSLIMLLASWPAAASAQIVPGAPGMDWNRERHEYTADVLRAYDKVMSEWRESWHGGNVRAVSEHYAEHAILFMPDTVPLQGRAAIAAQLTTLLPKTVELRTGLSDFVASERLAYALGPFYMELSTPGTAEKRLITGTHVTIMVREGRRWRIRSQVFRPQPTVEP